MIGVRCEIIVGALALTISLEFEIFVEKLKSTATSFHALSIAQPPPTQIEEVLPPDSTTRAL
ncbi:hypothetical protein [Lapidilactobacillus wuchangensis]|uniref:hypothetical protein n=1 Tax=Lapidilactobacillus wuchangensis TaxID=2486001 RepID=UPI0013DDA234|nr:hypothetical protein [Lapidilactobacillus wuchangensis]